MRSLRTSAPSSCTGGKGGRKSHPEAISPRADPASAVLEGCESSALSRFLEGGEMFAVKKRPRCWRHDLGCSLVQDGRLLRRRCRPAHNQIQTAWMPRLFEETRSFHVDQNQCILLRPASALQKIGELPSDLPLGLLIYARLLVSLVCSSLPMLCSGCCSVAWLLHSTMRADWVAQSPRRG